ncbi:hypothetical protein ARTHRO9AX_70009 [Arthrobacter sp. 9AX]|nr:hypothetical protein ARTHRO9AX_70009 [Arthrobacter sp. 9AX]
MGQCILGINEGIEQLIVVRRGEVEKLPDGLFLGAGVLPPLPLQGKHLLVPLTQRRVTEGKIGQERMPWFLLRQVLPSWLRHGTLLLLIAKMSDPHATGE